MNTRDPNTYLRGEACYQAKLTEVNVMDARNRVKSGASLRHVAERLGINRKTLADAINRRTWKHLAGAAALVIGITTAAHAGQKYLALGYGNATCQDIIQDPSGGVATVQWLQGYISGLNSKSSVDGQNAAVGGSVRLSSQQIYNLVEQYCIKYQSDSLSDVANVMYAYLYKNNQ